MDPGDVVAHQSQRLHLGASKAVLVQPLQTRVEQLDGGQRSQGQICPGQRSAVSLMGTRHTADLRYVSQGTWYILTAAASGHNYSITKSEEAPCFHLAGSCKAPYFLQLYRNFHFKRLRCCSFLKNRTSVKVYICIAVIIWQLPLHRNEP